MLALAIGQGVRAEVRFSGLTPEQEQNARALMPLAATACDSARWRVERLFRDSNARIGSALQALGYYDYDISKTLSWPETCWQASFDVRVGEPVRLAIVQVEVLGEGREDAVLRSVLPANSLVPGARLDHARYEAYKNTLLDAAFSVGYFDAAFDRREILVDKDASKADVFLTLNSGVRYRLGKISFTGGIIRDHILRQYTGMKEGDYYRSGAVNDLFSALNASSYFQSVYIDTEPLDRQARTVPVNVKLTPGKRKVYSAGLGFSSDIGPQGKLGYIDRRRNELGHQFESRISGSPVKSSLVFSYRFPHGDPREEWLSLSGGFQHEETDTSESDRFKLGISHSVSRSKGWLESRYVDYLDEKFTIGQQSDSTRLLVFGVNWGRVVGDELSRTQNGRRYHLDIRGASDSLGSDTSFLQAKATIRWVRSLDQKTRLLSRARLGATLKDSFTELPPSVRFFAGGDRSVRGYGFETLGPADGSGKVTGGSKLFDASIEVERMVRDQWAVAAFADTGSAFNHSDIDLSSSIGIGLRWYSPVGPLRLDIAHPLDDDDRTVRLHFTLGPDL